MIRNIIIFILFSQIIIFSQSNDFIEIKDKFKEKKVITFFDNNFKSYVLNNKYYLINEHLLGNSDLFLDENNFSFYNGLYGYLIPYAYKSISIKKIKQNIFEISGYCPHNPKNFNENIEKSNIEIAFIDNNFGYILLKGINFVDYKSDKKINFYLLEKNNSLYNLISKQRNKWFYNLSKSKALKGFNIIDEENILYNEKKYLYNVSFVYSGKEYNKSDIYYVIILKKDDGYTLELAVKLIKNEIIIVGTGDMPKIFLKGEVESDPMGYYVK